MNDFLEHYGIMGMKWGKRNSRFRKSTPSKPKADDRSPDSAAKDALKKKKLHQMSNAELRTLNERLQLERQYKDLTKTDISPGKKFVNELLTNSAKQVAGVYVAKYMAKGIDAAIKKATSSR